MINIFRYVPRPRSAALKPWLLNRLVIVHPDLTTDPYNQRGKVGFVTAVNFNQGAVDSLLVKFERGTGLYQPDGLITLLPEAQIKTNIRSPNFLRSASDYNEVVSILQHIGKDRLSNALLAPGGSKNIRYCCTQKLSDWIDSEQAVRNSKNRSKRL